MPDRLEEGNIPYDTEYLYGIFWDLWDSEGWSWSEAYHYQQTMGIELDGSELFILRRTAGACSSWLAEKTRPKKKNPPKQPSKGKGRN